MKKITGKVVSLVLALALVVTSFSANFAFASTKTVSGSVDLKEDDAKVLYLVNGGSKDSTPGDQTRVNLTDWITTQAKVAITMDTPDHQDVTVKNIVDVSHLSGDKLVKWGTEDSKAIDEDKPTYLTLKSGTNDGKEVISVLYKGTYTNEDGDEVNVKARQNITVNVADVGTTYIGKWYGTIAERTGKSIEAVDDFAQNSDVKDSSTVTDKIIVDSHEMGTYYAIPSADSALAQYVPFTVNKNTASTTNPFTLKVTGATDKFYYDVNSTTGKISAYTLMGAKSGSLTFTLTHTKNSDGTLPKYGSTSVSDDKLTGKAKIAKKVNVHNWSAIGKDKKTYVYTGALNDSSKEDNVTTGVAGTKIDVTGCEVNFDKNTMYNTAVTIDDKSSSVGKISGGFKSLEVKAGNVSSIDVDYGDITVGDAKVGDITTDADSKLGTATGTVTVSDGTVGNIDSKGEVTVNSGSTGDIKTDAAVDINGNDDDTATSVGAIEAGAETKIDSNNSKVSFKSYKAKSDSAKLTLTGDAVTSGKIDFDYRDNTILSFADFQGKATSPVNAINTTIETTDEDDDVAFTGAVNVDTIDVTDSSKVSFDSDVKTDYVTGSGILKVLAGKLYVSESVSGSPILKFTNDFKAGDIAFKADSDAVDVDDFDTFGFTVTKSAGTSVDTFKVASVKFAGLAIKGGNTEIAKGNSQTFTASSYPTGTAIPTGDKIDWDFEGNENNFKFTKNANGSVTVAVIAIDAEFTSENKGTLTAKLVDADGNDDTDYEETTLDVTAVAVASAVSDTNSALTKAPGEVYTMKVTSATAPVVTTGTAGVFSVALTSKTGNDYYYKLTATGKNGSSTGIFLNGNKIFVATVKAAAFTSDTTTKTTVKGSYQFKITSTATPTVTLGTAGVVNVSFVSKTNNSYIYKLTSAGKAGAQTGVFVNGSKVFVAVVG